MDNNSCIDYISYKFCIDRYARSNQTVREISFCDESNTHWILFTFIIPVTILFLLATTGPAYYMKNLYKNLHLEWQENMLGRCTKNGKKIWSCLKGYFVCNTCVGCGGSSIQANAGNDGAINIDLPIIPSSAEKLTENIYVLEGERGLAVEDSMLGMVMRERRNDYNERQLFTIENGKIINIPSSFKSKIFLSTPCYRPLTPKLFGNI